MAKKKTRKTIADLRAEAVARIMKAMRGADILRIGEIDGGCSPVIKENPDNDEFTQTLDTIKSHGGMLTFSASSSWDNSDYATTDLDLETLVEIAEFLEERQEEIDEWLTENNGELKTYVIRHHWRQWVDITVKAHNQEEAFELAGDRYNEGDYQEEPDNFENTDVEDVTSEYEENGIPM